ncbi:flavocytochrome c [Anaerocolumna sp.]|uniref:flavocytochrome c n=1 Tax=Anaerocolumna sp. TaxID=2041569 RepID=UPI0028AE55A6|nr:flavocytochrome c [Anaerocolumna sp.]
MKWMKKTIGLVLVCSMVVSLTACGSKKQQTNGETVTTTEEKQVSGYTPGEYEGVSSGYGGEMKVKVTVDETSITKIDIISHADTPGVSTNAFDQIPPAIIEQQSLAIDVVSGATFSSLGILNAVQDGLKKAGADIEALKKAPEKQETEKSTIEKTADVIVVGGGGAGLSAAITATDNGASVIVIEKTGVLGGNTLVCGGIYNCPDPELQEPEGIEDSPEFFAAQTWEAGDKVANKELVDTMCSNAYDGLVWLKELGVPFENFITQGAGSLYRRTHGSTEPNGTGFINAYVKNLSEKADLCEIMMNTKGIDLIVDGNKVVGVNAVDKDGNDIVLKANKSVILATGGFAGNVELRQKYCEGQKWPNLGTSVLTTNVKGVTGDGIIMAEKVGAGFVDMEHIQLLHLGNPKTGSIAGGVLNKIRSADEVIFVNKEGNRFIREDGRRDVICKAILEQTDGVMYIIHNGDNIDPESDEIKNMVKEGTVFRGETIEELAKQIGADPVNLQKSLDSYNACVDAGADTETGRELLNCKIEQGPYFATPRVPSAHHTMGGVRIDKECRVLGEDGTPIEGLIAAGEITGGIHGANRVGGNAVVDTVVFGRIAGETASR